MSFPAFLTSSSLAAAATLAGYLLTLFLIRSVLLTKKEQPSSTVAWIMVIVLIPLLGGLLFVIFGINRVDRRVRAKGATDRAIRRQFPRTASYQVFQTELKSPVARAISLVANRISSTPVTAGNDVLVMANTHHAMGLIEQAISLARHSIHLEYYIWQRDKTGTDLRDLVIRKARDGVKVRFLYDGIGSLYLNERFLKPMRDVGVEVAAFLPGATLRERWSFNLRNHRKIIVVDGKIGFTGGMNIGDEYLGRCRHRGYWRDTHLRVEGPAVLHLQKVFAEDWYFATNERLADPDFYPEHVESGNMMAQVIASGPLGHHNSSRLTFFEALAQARRSIQITTGYFVPPADLAQALETAALRGVHVQIMVPGRSSYLWTIFAGRSYYESLLDVGVEIYEYQRGALHAKTMTVDGEWSLVGTANVDARSLLLNFEVGLAITDRGVAEQLERQFELDIKDCLQIDPKTWHERPTWRVLSENAFRMFAPVL